jgi:hypothetical protein
MAVGDQERSQSKRGEVRPGLLFVTVYLSEYYMPLARAIVIPSRAVLMT